MKLVLSARREDRLTDLARVLDERHGAECVIAPADLARPGGAAALWERAANGRAIDLLVNNAGFGAQGDFHEIDLQRQADMVQLNCTSLLELAHLALRSMIPRRTGGIINVASIAAFQPVPTMATYAATKAFALSLSQALWAEASPAGVRVLGLCPGRTPTEFQQIAGTGSVERAFGLRSPEQVVQAALGAFEQNRSYTVPGAENYLATWLTRVMPRSPLTRGLKSMVRRAAARSANDKTGGKGI
jgi:short-subunit dehydrogenase